MPTEKRTVSNTEPMMIFDPNDTGDVAQINLQVIGANDIYVGHSQKIDTDNGPKISGAGGIYRNPLQIEPLWVIASGGSSDVRVTVVRFHDLNILRA